MPGIVDTTPGWVRGLEGASATVSSAMEGRRQQERHQAEMDAASAALERHELQMGQIQADNEFAQMRLDELGSLSQIRDKTEEEWAADSRQMFKTLSEGGLGGLTGAGIAGMSQAPKAMERFEQRTARLGAVAQRMSPQAREMMFARAEAEAQQEVLEEAQGAALDRWETAMRMGDLSTGSEEEDTQLAQAAQETMSLLSEGQMDPDEAQQSLNELRFRAASARASIKKREVDTQNMAQFIGESNDPRLLALGEGVANGSLTYDKALGMAFKLKNPEAAKQLQSTQLTPQEIYAMGYEMVSKSGLEFASAEEFQAAVDAQVERITPPPGIPPGSGLGFSVPGGAAVGTPDLSAPGAPPTAVGGGIPKSGNEAVPDVPVPPEVMKQPAAKRARKGMKGWGSFSVKEKQALLGKIIGLPKGQDPEKKLGIDLDTLPEEVWQAIQAARSAGSAPARRPVGQMGGYH
jgi:hypothetical protein